MKNINHFILIYKINVKSLNCIISYTLNYQIMKLQELQKNFSIEITKLLFSFFSMNLVLDYLNNNFILYMISKVDK
jgi:hypothetical protein